MVIRCVECRFYLAGRCHNGHRRKGRATSIAVDPEQKGCAWWAPILQKDGTTCAACRHWSRGWCLGRKIRRSEHDRLCAYWYPRA